MTHFPSLIHTDKVVILTRFDTYEHANGKDTNVSTCFSVSEASLSQEKK